MTDEVQVLQRLLVHERDRPKVLALCHDHAGHFGNKKTYKWIKEYYEWPGMKRDCKQFVQQCSVCAQTKHRVGLLPGLPHPLPVPSSPWQDVTIDLVTSLPAVKGVDAVCTVVDHFSKEAVLIPMTSMVTSCQLAKQFIHFIWSKH